MEIALLSRFVEGMQFQDRRRKTKKKNLAEAFDEFFNQRLRISLI